MICKNCGAEASGKFCNECGSPLVNEEAVNQQELVSNDVNVVPSTESSSPSDKPEKKVKAKKGGKGKLIAIIIAVIIVLAGGIFAIYELTKECEHEWAAATVSAPKTCKKCGETEGEALIAIPEVKGLDETTAKSLLAGKGLVPKVEYEYDDDVEEGQVIKTSPSIGSGANRDDIITIYMSKGPSEFYLYDSVGWMDNVYGINDFSWEKETKGFYTPYVKEGFLYIDMYLYCKSNYKLAFYKDFGTASINDTFDKTVPIQIIYDNEKVNNTGKRTEFTAKIPLSDLGVQKPTNIYLNFDFLVAGKRQTFNASFDLSW